MKSASQSADKFVQNAGAASNYYTQGAQQTTRDQAALAAAAEGVWFQAVTAANSRKAFSKGVSAAGKQAWLAGIQTKGANRFGEGVAAAREKYAANSGKYDGARGAAASLPRGPRGSAANYNRSAAVGKALNAARDGVSA